MIVEIDAPSFESVGSFPFPRWVYAQALNNLKPYSPAVVAFDILFLDPSTPQEDSVFQEALEKGPPVVLWIATDIVKKEVQLPLYSLYPSGFLFPNIESTNKTVYSFSPLFEDAQGIIYEHFWLQILRSFYASLYDDTNFLHPGSIKRQFYEFHEDIVFPLARKNSQDILINFVDPQSFTRISFWDLLDSKKLKQLNEEIGFQDKIFIIGPAAEWLKDDFFTPNGIEYGVNIHANILNTLLSKNYMMYFDRNQEWILIFFIIILSVSVNLSLSRKIILIWNTAIILIFWFVFPLSILLGTNLILNFPSEIIFSLILSLSAANVIKYLREDMNKQKLNKALTEYVGSNIAQEILLEEGKVNLDGEEKNLLYFFSDIEGFTSLSEKLSPQELVAFLREYLTAMTSRIMEQGGYVDKFEGDAVMAFWGAFSPLETQSYISLCEAALSQQHALVHLNTKWKEKFWHELSVRMGLHGGEAIVGNIWALGKKMDFTALGDNVNLASRLEGVNKFYGSYICASTVIYESTKHIYAYRFLDEIQVMWKDSSVKIYELLGNQKDIPDVKKDIALRFQKAWQFYAAQKFTQAKVLFEELQAAGDIPSETYIARCDMFLKNPPEAHWNGVWRMMEK